MDARGDEVRRIRMPRGRALTIAIVCVAVAVYALVVVLYALNTRTERSAGCAPEPDPDVITLSFEPTAVAAAADRMTVSVGVLSFGPVASPTTELASEPITLLITNTDGPRTYSISEDAIPSPVSVDLITVGYIERWPFDTHATDVAIVAFRDFDSPTPRSVPVALCGSVHVPGWTFSPEQSAGTDQLMIDDEEVTQLRIVAHRSVATVAFGIVILALMVVMPTLGLLVAIRVLRGRHKAESALMGWMAAMLFATIPLRTFLPGAPPVGSWVDYLIVLWVITGLVVALVVSVIAWLRWGPRGAGTTPG